MPLAVMSAMIVMMMTMGVMPSTMVVRRPRRGRGRRKRNDCERTQNKNRQSNCPIQRTQLNHPQDPFTPPKFGPTDDRPGTSA